MSEPGKRVMLGTAGHVDHGKTALVRLLTGCETDTLAAEKQRGLTIELGFAPCRMANERILGVVDVPGHVDFIRNMATGAHGIDVVILVVAADDGIMPQTREHVDILTLMGVRGGLVAVTKIDMVEPEMKEIVVEEVGEFVRGTFLEAAAICPISSITGEGFDGFFTALNAAVDAAEPHDPGGLFRMWIERSFHVKGFGTVVSGIPVSGSVVIGDRLRLLPGGPVGRVRGMEVYGSEADVGQAGECVAMNLADIDAAELTRGKVLCEGPSDTPSMVEAELKLLDHVPRPVPDYLEAHVYIGTAEVMANVAMLETSQLAPGESGFVQLRMRQPLGAAVGERFVIRASVAGLAAGRVTTIGGGRILGLSDRRLRRRRPWTIELLAKRRDALGSRRAWCAQCLEESPAPLAPAELTGPAGLKEAECRQILALLAADGLAVEVEPGRFAHRESIARAARTLRGAVEAFHDANPMRLGIEAAALRAEADLPASLADEALRSLLADGALAEHGTVLAAAGRATEISPEDRRLFEQIEETLREARLEPPLPAVLAETLAQPLERINDMIRMLVDGGSVLRLDPKVAMHRDAVAAAEKVVVGLFREANSFETVRFRDALGVSRKFAVPLLDYFDTVKLTVRAGSRRRPGARAKELLGRA